MRIFVKTPNSYLELQRDGSMAPTEEIDHPFQGSTVTVITTTGRK